MFLSVFPGIFGGETFPWPLAHAMARSQSRCGYEGLSSLCPSRERMWNVEVLAPSSRWGPAGSLHCWHKPCVRAEASFGWKLNYLIHPHQPRAGRAPLGLSPAGGACSDRPGELCSVTLLSLHCSCCMGCLSSIAGAGRLRPAGMAWGGWGAAASASSEEGPCPWER